ncbi:hypothetical protein A0H81_11898 [Grifola frondosa]|uniref:Transcriptional activator HAP2 n=1 Tax=Grifola frondosa TaxID=5627 RepID=A0A1C7LV16_GRIFR|nr:hypothetical protein A0H81_11898 [Grifola frondosa]
MRRPRGPGGRFLTAEEIAAQKATERLDAGPSGSASIDGDADDDDVDQTMADIDTKDLDMAVDSPSELEKPSPPLVQPPPQPEKRDQRPLPISQIPLQPRPQLMQQQLQSLPPPAPPQPQSQPQPQPQLLPQPQQQPQLQPPPSAPTMQSPYDHMSLGHSAGPINLMNVGFHPLSHPATPAPISPHPIEGLQNMDHVRRDHAQHVHDHSRRMVPTANMPPHISREVSVAHSQSAATPNPAPPPPAVNLRAPYAAMQMHHVPHPHAHARHHSFLSRSERLYAPDNNIIGISGESTKGDFSQRRPDDNMIHFGNGGPAGSSRR